MKATMKKAFTLVEMLVVIGIIAVLMGVLISTISGGTESARNAKCLSNLKALANACHSYGGATGYYPLAGSVELVSVGATASGSASKGYWEMPGWLSWYSNNAYNGNVRNHIASGSWFVSAYDKDFDKREYCYTNGAIWASMNGSREAFRCPVHADKFKNSQPAWSYVMNAFFGWDNSEGSKAKSYEPRKKFSTLSRADRRLLFAEIPFMGFEVTPNTSASSGTENDCTLQTGDKYGEVIGFNHTSKKKSKYAHVVFADGHTEQIAWPKTGIGEAELKELTKWLCEGADVAFNGEKYEELKN